jgi:hypothetical protein
MTPPLDLPDASPEATPLSELLAHVAAELRGLCAAAYTVEAAVGALISTATARGAEEMRGLQELDRLIQHMDGLAAYLAAIAEAAEGMGAVDAAAARRLVKIARLADSLAGRPPRGVQTPCDETVEFF